MKVLSKLKSELEKNQRMENQIRDQILNLVLKKKMPALKKKYEGRFWKYRKSTGYNSVSWIYSYCREVKDESNGSFDMFESTEHKNVFKINETEFLDICESEISKSEYLRELKKFQSKANELTNCP